MIFTYTYLAIAIIYAICFFVLCINVARIKKTLLKQNRLNDYKKHMLYGDLEDAAISLKDVVWDDLKKAKSDYFSSVDAFNRQVEIIKEKYQSEFESMDMVFPEVRFKDIYI